MSTGAMGATVSGNQSSKKIIPIVAGTGQRLRNGDSVQINGAGGAIVIQDVDSFQIITTTAISPNDGDRLTMLETY